jgi:hypothetical protein
LSDYERRQILGARLAGAFVIKPNTLLGVLRATVPKVMSAHTNHAKRNSGRKSTMTERDRLILRRTVVTEELNIYIHLEDPVSAKKNKKLFDVCFKNPTSTVGLHLLNL